MHLLRRQRLRAPDVVVKVRVAAVDDGVSGGQPIAERRDRRLRGFAGRHHHPDGSRRRQRGDNRIEGGRAAGAGGFGLRHRIGAAIEGDDLVAAPLEARHHVQAHLAESDKTKLHRVS